ncbi:MAG: hypothetical protein H6Q05_756 [Acidobacteria bacterium]|nr:hypothetical protein [Acidobacteriota bacterium]
MLPLGLATVTCATPAGPMSDAGMLACNWLTPKKVVVRDTPFHRTADPAAKFNPLTVSLNAAPPAFTCAGFRSAITGAAAPD